MTSAVATTSATGFTGADVQGLDKLSQEFTEAAEVCDAVKAACEVIVAAASMFGPFGAAFVAYLKGTVIPWLTKISEALKLMAKVLSLHSQAQTNASSAATSLPSYVTPTALPQTSTTNYPTLPVAAPPASPPAAGTTPTTPGSASVATPPSIGSTASTAAAATAAHPTTSTDPTVQTITALTGLVTAVGHLVNPTSTAATTTPVTATPITATTTTGSDGLTSVPSITSVGATPTTGSIGNGGIDLSTLQPLHPGDTVGVVSVPVDISPNGTITPLIHTPASTAAVPTTPAAPISATPAHVAPTTQTAHLPGTDAGSAGGSGGGTGGGSGSGGGIGGGSGGGSPTVTTPAHAITTAAHTVAHTAGASTAHGPAEAGALTSSGGAGAGHDGLYSGLGQATGIGAGGAALARATLHEARQRAEGLLGAVSLPSDSLSDGAAQAHIFDGELR